MLLKHSKWPYMKMTKERFLNFWFQSFSRMFTKYATYTNSLNRPEPHTSQPSLVIHKQIFKFHAFRNFKTRGIFSKLTCQRKKLDKVNRAGPSRPEFSRGLDRAGQVGVPAVGGLNFSMAQKKVQKSASWGTGASWGTKINPWTDDFFPIL